MPLIQTLPSTWSAQHVIANTSNTNIATNDVIISNSGMKYGTTGKRYIALKMPFCSFYISNQGAGTSIVVFSRASDGVPLYATVLSAVTDTDGNQFRNVVLPVDDPSGITITTTKTGTVSLSIVANGITDSGLLPLPAMPTQTGIGQTFTLGGSSKLGGSQTISMGGMK